MAILLAESYAEVRELVTDVKVLSKKERNHVLWYACDGGNLDMMKSVIRAGCDVDHFHRGHTPLMMASIRGHHDVVKELILAGCRVDLRSKECLVDWYSFITKMASAWPNLVAWTLLMIAMIVMEVGMRIMEVRQTNLWCYCFHFLIMALCLRKEEVTPFWMPRMLEMKAVARVMAWVGLLASSVVFLVVAWTQTEAVVQMGTVAVKGAREVASVALAMVMAMAVAMVVAMALAGAGRRALGGAVAGAVVVAWAVAWAGALGMFEDVRVAFQELVGVLGLVAEIMPMVNISENLVAADVTLTKMAAAVEVADIWVVFWVMAGAVVVAGGMSVVGTMAVAVAVVWAGADAVAVASAEAKMVAVAWDVSAALIAGSMISWLTWGYTVPGVSVAFSLLAVKLKFMACSVTGMTALHYAAWYNHIACGVHLVEAGANTREEIRYYRTPVHVGSSRFKDTIQTTLSVSAKQVIAVIGNSGCGKSTLIAALQSACESKTWLQSLVNKFAQVHTITQRTAGIETVPFSSAKYGEVLFYDFAGQCSYHGPHQSFLDAMLCKPRVSVIMLLLVKVTDSADEITQQLIRWLQPLAHSSAPSTPQVIVVGSFLDQAKTKKMAQEKLQGCIDLVQKEFYSLMVLNQFLLDCREPLSSGINGLSTCFQRTHPIQLISTAYFGHSVKADKLTRLLSSTSTFIPYNAHWVMVQLKKSFSNQPLQLNKFSMWLQDNALNLPRSIQPPGDVCRDLSAAGYIFFLPNKQDASQSWLILDLQSILHNVYGTLFSTKHIKDNQFGLVHYTILSVLFPNLDVKMIQDVLITLEFCIKVDPLLLNEEMLSLTKHDEAEGWLYFPALVSAKAHEVFTPGLDPDCLHWACWQLKTDDNHIILAHLLQGILLHLAVSYVFVEKELPRSARKHCCRVWMNGLSWESTKGVDVAVHISDSNTVQVIGRSLEGPGELYRYMSSVTQSIFKTIAKLSPALKATPYIIHPYTYIGLDESTSSPPTTQYPVASVIGSIEAGDKYVFSLPISSGSGSVNHSRVSLQDLFGEWSPSLTVVQQLKEAQADPRE